MAKNPSQDENKHPLKGIAADILKEVIKADMSMHDAQIKAWQWFAKNRPKGEYINDDIYDGFARSLYLSLSELNLQWYVRPKKLNLWSRLVMAFKILFQGLLTLNYGPIVLEMCSKEDPMAMNVNIKVTRYKNGTVKASYSPADNLTEELLNF